MKEEERKEDRRQFTFVDLVRIRLRRMLVTEAFTGKHFWWKCRINSIPYLAAAVVCVGATATVSRASIQSLPVEVDVASHV